MANENGVFAEAGGRPSHHDTAIPQLWSGKIVRSLYHTTILNVIANRDWEGEIRQGGDVVNIRKEPDVNVFDYVKGQPIPYETPSVSKIQLLINRSKGWAVTEDDVDRAQTDMKLMDLYAKAAGMKMSIAIDREVLASVGMDAHPSNQGNNAGVETAKYRLGTAMSPTYVKARIVEGTEATGAGKDTAKGIVRYITQLCTVLDQQNVPREGRYLIVTPEVEELLVNSELGDAYLSGDNVSMKRMGWTGRIGGFDVFKSQLMPYGDAISGDRPVNILAGTKLGISFASQLMNTETLRPSGIYGSAMRGLNVYGFEVTKPEAILSGYVVPLLT